MKKINQNDFFGYAAKKPWNLSMIIQHIDISTPPSTP